MRSVKCVCTVCVCVCAVYCLCYVIVACDLRLSCQVLKWQSFKSVDWKVKCIHIVNSP